MRRLLVLLLLFAAFVVDTPAQVNVEARLKAIESGTVKVKSTGSSKARALRDRFADVVNVKDEVPDGYDYTTTDGASYLAAAQTRAGSTKTIVVNTPVRIASAAGTVSAALRFEGNGKLVAVTGGSVTLTGALTAPLSQIFDTSGGGTITFQGKVDKVVPQWWGAVGVEAFNATSAIQAAIDAVATSITASVNVGTTIQPYVFFPPGVYVYTTLTVSAPVKLVGSGMNTTFLKTVAANTNSITVTAVNATNSAPGPVEFVDLSIGAAVTQTSGSLVNVMPATGFNAYSLFRRVAFHDAYTALTFTSAAFFVVDECYFNAYTGNGVIVQNVNTPDSGDSVITSTTFNNGTGVAINHKSGGGLRITNNKFLGGTYHYLSDFNTFPVHTGQLIIADNSFDQASQGNIVFNETGGTPYTLIEIADNVIFVSAGAVGVWPQAHAVSYLHGMTIGGNIFALNAGATGIVLNGIEDAAIFPNVFWGQGGGGITGIAFGDAAGPITIYPQTMHALNVNYSGSQAAATFVQGEIRTNAGNPNNALTPNFIGELAFNSATNQWFRSYGTAGTQWRDVTSRPLSADRGDTSQTLVWGTDAPQQLWATTLTANRTITLSAVNAQNGDTFRIVRTGLGAFTLDVGGLKTIPSATAAAVEVTYDGSAWVLTGYQLL